MSWACPAEEWGDFGGSGSDPAPLKMSVIAYFWQSWPCWLIWNRFQVVTFWAELARFYGTLIKGLSGAPRQKKCLLIVIFITPIDNSRTGLDTSKNQCSAPAVTALKNYWRYHVYNLFRLKNSSNVFAIIIIIIGCLTGNIIHDQLKLRPYFLPWVSKNRIELLNCRIELLKLNCCL